MTIWQLLGPLRFAVSSPNNKDGVEHFEYRIQSAMIRLVSFLLNKLCRI